MTFEKSVTVLINFVVIIKIVDVWHKRKATLLVLINSVIMNKIAVKLCLIWINSLDCVHILVFSLTSSELIISVIMICLYKHCAFNDVWLKRNVTPLVLIISVVMIKIVVKMCLIWDNLLDCALMLFIWTMCSKWCLT